MGVLKGCWGREDADTILISISSIWSLFAFSIADLTGRNLVYCERDALGSGHCSPSKALSAGVLATTKFWLMPSCDPGCLITLEMC